MAAKHRNQVTIFRGDPATFASSTLMLLSFLNLLMSIFVGGMSWLRMFLFFSIALPPTPALAWLFARYLDWFRLDDERQTVVTSFRRPIPYEKIRGVYVRQVGPWLLVKARTGRSRFQQELLVQTLSRREESKLERALLERFGDRLIRRRPRRLSDLKSFMAVEALTVCALYAVLYVSFDLYTWTQVVPQRKSWACLGDASIEMESFELGALHFSVPGTFELLHEDNKYMEYRSRDTKAKLKVVLSQDIKVSSRFERYALGLDDEYDFWRMVFYARYWVPGLTIKAHTLWHLYDVRLYEIEHPELVGFLARGTRRGLDIAEIDLIDRDVGQGLEFTLSSYEHIADKTLQTIISSVAGETPD